MVQRETEPLGPGVSYSIERKSTLTFFVLALTTDIVSSWRPRMQQLPSLDPLYRRGTEMLGSLVTDPDSDLFTSARRGGLRRLRTSWRAGEHGISLAAEDLDD